MSDPLEDVLDATCAMETLRRYLDLPDGEPMREMMMPAIAHLECGHQRPTNRKLQLGDGELCLICGVGAGDQRVVEVEMLPEPRWFPHPDALTDLPSPE